MSKTIISLAFTESVIGMRKRSLYRTIFRLCIVNDAHKTGFLSVYASDFSTVGAALTRMHNVALN